MKWYSAAGMRCGDGSLTIDRDPDGSIPGSYVTASSGTPGHGVEADQLTWVAPNMVGGIGLGGQAMGVWFTGDPGPIGCDGAPESLAGFVGNPVYVWAKGGYHEEYGFQLQTLPEPSGLLLLPLGLVGIALGRGVRSDGRGHEGMPVGDRPGPVRNVPAAAPGRTR